jgi:hypothetical protein
VVVQQAGAIAPLAGEAERSLGQVATAQNPHSSSPVAQAPRYLRAGPPGQARAKP